MNGNYALLSVALATTPTTSPTRKEFSSLLEKINNSIEKYFLINNSSHFAFHSIEIPTFSIKFVSSESRNCRFDPLESVDVATIFYVEYKKQFLRFLNFPHLSDIFQKKKSISVEIAPMAISNKLMKHVTCQLKI